MINDYLILMKRFQNKICLITGGTAGIGLATAQRFGKEGGVVIICSRNKKRVTEASDML